MWQQRLSLGNKKLILSKNIQATTQYSSENILTFYIYFPSLKPNWSVMKFIWHMKMEILPSISTSDLPMLVFFLSDIAKIQQKLLLPSLYFSSKGRRIFFKDYRQIFLLTNIFLCFSLRSVSIFDSDVALTFYWHFCLFHLVCSHIMWKNTEEFLAFRFSF